MSILMMENYTRVRLQTNKYQAEGASKGDLGYVIEIYPDGCCEVEFSDENGITFAQFVAQADELQQNEPFLLTQSAPAGNTVMETVPLTPPSVEQQSQLIRSNKK